MRKHVLPLLLLVTLLSGMLCFPAAAEEAPKFKNYDKALSWVKKNHPAELTLEDVRFKPRELLNLRANMAEGGVLHFSTFWCGTTITDRDTYIDLNKGKVSVSQADVEALIALCPDLKKIRFSAHRNLSNKIMFPMIEKYPDIEFVWLLSLNRAHVIPTDATAYSTFNNPNDDYKLRSSDLELLRYVPGLKGLDLGHNSITTLEWLRYCPDLEFLILADNWISDVTMIGTLSHLQYLEIFLNEPLADISPIGQCTELLDLNISANNKVTDLTALDSLQKLERMWGTRMYGLTDETKEHFIATHPDTLTYFTRYHSTEHGWRKHERYKHYIWCLKNKTWIPFDQPLPSK